MSAIKLHLGCGLRKIHGFINVDLDEFVEPDLVNDVFLLTEFGHDFADLIYAAHVLEHSDRKEAIGALRRWFDVLKPGGLLRVAVPDLRAVCEYYSANGDLRQVMGLLYGGQKDIRDFHCVGWDETTLTEDLVTAGFKNPHRYDWRMTEHFYVDDFSACYLPRMEIFTRRPEGKIDGKLMSLNMEAIKP